MNIQSIKVKATKEQVRVVYSSLQNAIQTEPHDRQEAQMLVTLYRLFLKVRVRYEAGQKNLVFKAEEALAFWNWFGIDPLQSHRYEANTLNMICIELDRVLI